MIMSDSTRMSFLHVMMKMTSYNDEVMNLFINLEENEWSLPGWYLLGSPLLMYCILMNEGSLPRWYLLGVPLLMYCTPVNVCPWYGYKHL